MHAVLSEIQELAPQVVAIGEDFSMSIDTQQKAEADVLDAAIALAMPALRTICYPVKVAYTRRWIDNASTEDETEHSQWKGLYLVGTRGPDMDHPRANCGAYEGWDLLLREDGKLVELTYSGHWTKWQGSATHWDVKKTRVMTAFEAMEWEDLEDCLAAIRDALKRAIEGKKPEQAKLARERAEKLSAMVTLSR